MIGTLSERLTEHTHIPTSRKGVSQEPFLYFVFFSQDPPVCYGYILICCERNGCSLHEEQPSVLLTVYSCEMTSVKHSFMIDNTSDIKWQSIFYRLHFRMYGKL